MMYDEEMVMTAKETFRMRLRDLINTLGISQREFASRANMTPAALSQVLDGKRAPGCETIIRISLSTGASLDRLFGMRNP